MIGDIYVCIITDSVLLLPNSSLKPLMMGYKLSKIEIGVMNTTQPKNRITTNK